MTTPMKPNKVPSPPYKVAGLALVLIVALITALVFLLFRGYFIPKEQLTMLAGRAGLVMDPGAPVTFNGVQIGRVTGIKEVQRNGEPAAEFTLDVNPKYIDLIPANVDAQIKATTVFGSKYVALASPEDPAAQPISTNQVIDATHVTTEFNTLFETVISVAEQVDPIKLNQTLAAAAESLQGLGDRFGQAIVDGNTILADINPQMPQLREDIAGLADLGEVYANAAPQLFDGLENAITPAITLNEQRGNLDQALMSAIGFGNTGADIFERGGPYLVRGAQDLIPTSELLDEYSPALFCTVKGVHDAAPKIQAALAGNGYSLNTRTFLLGAGNPYVYPDNMPRVNAKGGPEGRPGCWQQVTRDLWPLPYLVADTGASIAPYNHIELGQPLAVDYVWGRQIGEYTINP